MKPLEQKKHREFVVIACQEGTYQAHQWRNSHLNLINSWHVIEYSAILEMEKRAEELVKALEFYAGDNYESVYEDDEMDLDRLLDREDVSFDETDKYFGRAGSKAREALKQWKENK